MFRDNATLEFPAARDSLASLVLSVTLIRSAQWLPIVHEVRFDRGERALRGADLPVPWGPDDENVYFTALVQPGREPWSEAVYRTGQILSAMDDLREYGEIRGGRYQNISQLNVYLIGNERDAHGTSLFWCSGISVNNISLPAVPLLFCLRHMSTWH